MSSHADSIVVGDGCFDLRGKAVGVAGVVAVVVGGESGSVCWIRSSRCRGGDVLDVVVVDNNWLLWLGNVLEGGDEVVGGVCRIVCGVIDKVSEVEADARHGR